MRKLSHKFNNRKLPGGNFLRVIGYRRKIRWLSPTDSEGTDRHTDGF